MKKILFNNISKSKNYLKHVEHLFSDYNLIRNKYYSNLCIKELQPMFPKSHLLLTHSATGGLEIIAHLLDVEKGDEIIMPSFTFVSSANAFVTQGATPVFVDIEKETLNLDLDLVEKAITEKTKAVVAVHYAGHPCDLNKLKEICDRHRIYLIEDAAMAFGNTYEGKQLGGIGDFGVISFDSTKHISAIQGVLLIINNEKFQKRANNIYHIGTNRSEFQEGNVPYYEWVDIGSKYQMNELNAAVLFEQLNLRFKILEKRQTVSALYFQLLNKMSEKNYFSMLNKQLITQNFHEFYIITKSKVERDNLLQSLTENNIEALFHYNPLHISKKGKEIGVYIGNNNSIIISNCLLRLPMHDELEIIDIENITNIIQRFYEE